MVKAWSKKLPHLNFPQNPETNWSQFSDQKHEILLFRLGNMTLLSSGQNQSLGNLPYARKREQFAQSQFVLTSKLAEENEEWTPERIDNRQRWMARQADSIWRISLLDDQQGT
ncbi:HNH endonuclease family protein [Roseibacillus ishigakijimensis]|uniref:HNH endonuclease n=1 Tax=Roseibacillus ishigakijimensis TaxID=454146 RepID=A0A934RPH4_9BACT|nr:HNH endonuclease family protein [Roseibacillus ishigakijimensis]MBK1835612.1 HNH endonuclease [Roseibacillus ishigakijimensis]